MYVTKELLAFFEYDNIDPFTYGEKQLLNYLKFYDNNRQYELKIIKENKNYYYNKYFIIFSIFNKYKC